VRQGFSQTFYPSGRVKMKGNYVSGKKEGIFQYFYHNGYLDKEETYQNGEVVSTKDYDEFGKPVPEMTAQQERSEVPNK